MQMKSLIKLIFNYKKYKPSKLYGKGNAGFLIAKYLFKISPPIQKKLSFIKK